MKIIGMNAKTGRKITDIEHIWQSCRDILTTLIGTRIERRDYGSLLPELIDHPHNAPNNLRLIAATVIALAKWEARIAIRQVNVTLGAVDGATNIDMQAVRIDGPQAGNSLSINIPIGGLR